MQEHIQGCNRVSNKEKALASCACRDQSTCFIRKKNSKVKKTRICVGHCAFIHLYETKAGGYLCQHLNKCVAQEAK